MRHLIGRPSRTRGELLAAAGALLLCGCASFHRGLDHYALEAKANQISNWAQTHDPGAEAPFLSSTRLEELSRPSSIEPAFAPLAAHRLDVPGLRQELLSFESAAKLTHRSSDRAFAYVYRKGRLGERPVLLWVPGQSVDDRSFAMLGPYFRAILARGVDVVFVVTPLHLERTPPGYASGDAFLAAAPRDHLGFFVQALSELRSLSRWLRAQGVPVLGATGSSLGGSLLLQMSTWSSDFDFLSLVIPVVRWDLLMVQPEMEPVRARLRSMGMTGEELLRTAYRALDPTNDQPMLDPWRIAIYYGRFDRIAPPQPIRTLAERWGVRRLRGYDRGHVLMYMSQTLQREMMLGLDADLDTLGAGMPREVLLRDRPPPGWPLGD